MAMLRDASGGVLDMRRCAAPIRVCATTRTSWTMMRVIVTAMLVAVSTLATGAPAGDAMLVMKGVDVDLVDEGTGAAPAPTASMSRYYSKVTLPAPPMFYIPSFGYRCNKRSMRCKRGDGETPGRRKGYRLKDMPASASVGPTLMRGIQLPAPKPIFIPRGNAPHVASSYAGNENQLIDTEAFEAAFGVDLNVGNENEELLGEFYQPGDVLILDPDLPENANASNVVYNPVTQVPKPPRVEYYTSSLIRTDIIFEYKSLVILNDGRNVTVQQDRLFCCIDDFYNFNITGSIPANATFPLPFGNNLTIFFTGKTEPPRVITLPRDDAIPLHVRVSKKKAVQLDFPSFGLEPVFPDFQFKKKPEKPEHLYYDSKLERTPYLFDGFPSGIDDFNPVPPVVNVLNPRTKGGFINQDVKFVKKKLHVMDSKLVKAHIKFPAFEVVHTPASPPPPPVDVIHFNSHFIYDAFL